MAKKTKKLTWAQKALQVSKAHQEQATVNEERWAEDFCGTILKMVVERAEKLGETSLEVNFQMLGHCATEPVSEHGVRHLMHLLRGEECGFEVVDDMDDDGPPDLSEPDADLGAPAFSLYWDQTSPTRAGQGRRTSHEDR